RPSGQSGARIGLAPGAPLHPGESPMAKKTGTTAQAATGGITKQEAVRRALSALGKAASAKDIQKYVKETFGFEVTIEHIYNAKSNARERGKKKARKRRAATKPPAPEPTSAAEPPAQVVPVARQPAGW